MFQLRSEILPQVTCKLERYATSHAFIHIEIRIYVCCVPVRIPRARYVWNSMHRLYGWRRPWRRLLDLTVTQTYFRLPLDLPAITYICAHSLVRIYVYICIDIHTHTYSYIHCSNTVSVLSFSILYKSYASRSFYFLSIFIIYLLFQPYYTCLIT